MAVSSRESARLLGSSCVEKDSEFVSGFTIKDAILIGNVYPKRGIGNHVFASSAGLSADALLEISSVDSSSGVTII